MTRRMLVIGLVVLAAAASAAGCGGSDASGPPEIEYGRDMCEECHMIISDERFASAYRDADGEEHLFDDPGDLLSSALKGGGLEDAEVWVHDFGTKEWVDAESAFYVVGGEGVQSPMGWGIVAYAEEADAEAFADDSRGRIVAWEDLVGMARSGDLEPGAGQGTGPVSDGAGNLGGDQ